MEFKALPMYSNYGNVIIGPAMASLWRETTLLANPNT